MKENEKSVQWNMCRRAISRSMENGEDSVQSNVGKKTGLYGTDGEEVPVPSNARARRSFVSAYLTVEASMIMPMVLCILVICIYVAFLLYDRCILYQDAYLVCLRESYRKDEDGPSVDTAWMDEEASDVVGSRAFAVDLLSGEASSDGEWAWYQGTAVVAPAVFGTFFLMPQEIWNIAFSAKSRKTDPSWSIRSWRRKSYVVKAGLTTLTETWTSSE